MTYPEPVAPATKMTPMKAIRTFFEADGGRKVGMDELKALPKADRDEIAPLCAQALGVELEAATA